MASPDRGRVAPPVATDAEVRALVDRRRLHGTGTGWVDAQLLAATLLAGASARLWTADRRLAVAAEALGCAAEVPSH